MNDYSINDITQEASSTDEDHRLLDLAKNRDLAVARVEAALKRGSIPSRAIMDCYYRYFQDLLPDMQARMDELLANLNGPRASKIRVAARSKTRRHIPSHDRPSQLTSSGVSAISISSDGTDVEFDDGHGSSLTDESRRGSRFDARFQNGAGIAQFISDVDDDFRVIEATMLRSAECAIRQYAEDHVDFTDIDEITEAVFHFVGSHRKRFKLRHSSNNESGDREGNNDYNSAMNDTDRLANNSYAI